MADQEGVLVYNQGGGILVRKLKKFKGPAKTIAKIVLVLFAVFIVYFIYFLISIILLLVRFS